MIKENVLKLESVEVSLVYCNLVIKWFSTYIKNVFTFVLNKRFGQLICIAPHSLTMLNTTKTKFCLLKFGLLIKTVNFLKLKTVSIWPWELGKYKTEAKYRKYVKDHGFLSFARKVGDKWILQQKQE